ncbi:hypothetical protein ACFLQV_03825 [Calditrichota bacterium]
MILKYTKQLLWLSFAFMLTLTACSDERTPPTVAPDPSYTETYVLMDRVNSNGSEVSASINVRDVIVSGEINIYCFIEDDADLASFYSKGDRISELDATIADTLDPRLGTLEFYETIDSLVTADSLELADLRRRKTRLQNTIVDLNRQRDSLDVILDNRFTVSVKLDDGAWRYPQASILDYRTKRNDAELWADSLDMRLDYLTALPDSQAFWGQGTYLSDADTLGWRGRKFALNLTEFWVADLSWVVDEKPVRDTYLVLQPGERAPDQYTKYELFPVRSWLNAITTSQHTLTVRLGNSGTQTQVSASLYAVHETEG